MRNKRIPVLLESSELERHVGLSLGPEHSRIMICGIPDIVEDTRGWFVENGYTISRKARQGPGHLALDKSLVIRKRVGCRVAMTDTK